jgi:hypothetical protein
MFRGLLFSGMASALCVTAALRGAATAGLAFHVQLSSGGSSRRTPQTLPYVAKARRAAVDVGTLPERSRETTQIYLPNCWTTPARPGAVTPRAALIAAALAAAVAYHWRHAVGSQRPRAGTLIVPGALPLIGNVLQVRASCPSALILVSHPSSCTTRFLLPATSECGRRAPHAPAAPNTSPAASLGSSLPQIAKTCA